MTKPKQYKITNKQLEEMVWIITDCNLSEDEAIKYAKSVLKEFNKDNEK